MTYQITEDTIQLLAQLSGLKLSEEEVRTLLSQLQEILNYIERIKQLKTPKKGETLKGEYQQKNVFLDVNQKPRRFKRDKALQNASTKQDGYFVVPKVLDK